jgi:hypothetical protein
MLSIATEYNPSNYYLQDLLQKLFAGGFEDSGLLEDRFSAWKQLAALPALKYNPRVKYSSWHYKGELSTNKMKCPIADCG